MRSVKYVILITSWLARIQLISQDDDRKIGDEIIRELKVDNAERTEKAAFFDDGNYAMFIHWGIYSY